MENLTSQLVQCLAQNREIVVATVLKSHGSTPRTSGSRMIVLKDKEIFGTIGGGLVEAKVIDHCMELLGTPHSRMVDFSLNKEIKDGLDMVCGGNLTVLLEGVLPGTETAALLQKAAELENQGKKAIIVTGTQQGNRHAQFTPKKALIHAGNAAAGSLVLPKPLAEAIDDDRFSGTVPTLFQHGLDHYIVEPIPVHDTIFIFGAGHVGFKLAQMAHLTDFQTVIIDDREEFANADRFPHASAVHVVDDFAHAFDSLDINRYSFIVILTRGHLHDQTVLSAALKTDPAYIGMIGSKPKRRQIYENLMKDGVAQKDLENIFSPIGMAINAETPAEIAVSIMGQIIHQRACR